MSNARRQIKSLRTYVDTYTYILYTCMCVRACVRAACALLGTHYNMDRRRQDSGVTTSIAERVVCIFPDCTTTAVCGCVNRSQSKYICTHKRNAAHCTLWLAQWCNRMSRTSCTVSTILFVLWTIHEARRYDEFRPDNIQRDGPMKSLSLKLSRRNLDPVVLDNLLIVWWYNRNEERAADLYTIQSVSVGFLTSLQTAKIR